MPPVMNALSTMPERPDTVTCVIVDDEESARRTLSRLLEKYHPDLRIAGRAEDVPSGLDLVTRERPDILFLDVDMGGRTGFDLLRALPGKRPQVIFTTAHAGYAVNAIKFSALDYLVKPIDRMELSSAIARARELVGSTKDDRRYEELLKNMDRAIEDRVIALPISTGLQMVHVNEIVACEADGQYTTIHMRGGKLLLSKALGEFEELLDDPRFIRVHHGQTVNIKHIKQYKRGEGGEVIMSNDMSIPVSKRKKAELLDKLGRA